MTRIKTIFNILLMILLFFTAIYQVYLSLMAYQNEVYDLATYELLWAVLFYSILRKIEIPEMK